MGSIKRFEDLEIWQLAKELVNYIYQLTNKEKFSKDYGLKNQICRSSVSVMNNTSEGFESQTTKHFINYLGIAGHVEKHDLCHMLLLTVGTSQNQNFKFFMINVLQFLKR